MDKNYIDITLNTGEIKKMEIVSTFKIENYPYDYIIYCELDKSHYYLAKYMNDNLNSLSTDFNEDEFLLANKIFEGVVNENEVRN